MASTVTTLHTDRWSLHVRKPERDGDLYTSRERCLGRGRQPQVSHRRRTSSHIGIALRRACASHGSRPITPRLVSTGEYRRAFGEALRPLASGHRCHRCHHFMEEGVWICGRDTRVLSRVYGLSPRGCCRIVVTAVTVVTLVTVLCGLILDRERISTYVGHYPFKLTRRTRRG
jgi:hypothetical protein